jgi:hypothetical protein
LEDRRNVGESNCNSGDETGQVAEPWMFMMMIIILYVETAGTLRMEEARAFWDVGIYQSPRRDISRDLSVLQHRISTKNLAHRIGYLTL